MATLRDVVERARRGVGAAAIVEGEGGIGKTRLIEEIAREAGASGVETYVGRAEELERSRPFGALAHALRGLGRDVRDLLWGTTDDGATGALPSVSEARVVELVLDLIEERAIHRPVLICIEDLHWADPATLLFCGAATRRLEGLPLAVIGTCRPAEESNDLRNLVDRVVAEGHVLVRLGPLDASGVEMLVRDAVGGEPGPLLLHEVARASGSPFYVLELLSALDEEGAILREDGRAELGRALLPPTLRVTILRRLASLPPATLETLRLASIVGSGFSVDDLALLARGDVLDLHAVLDPAIRSGFITERDDRLGFRHDLVHAALYEDMSAPLRKTLHRKLADAMAAAGRPITTVATHMSLGAEPGDLQAAAWLMEAELALGVTAIGVAVEFGQRAIEVAPHNARILGDFLAIHVLALAVTRRSAQAEALARDVLKRDLSPLSTARARHGLAHALTTLGRLDEAIEERKIIRADRRLSDGFRSGHIAELAWMLFGAGEIDQTVAMAEEALEVSTRCRDAFGVCVGHMALSFTASARGRVGEAVRHGAEAADMSEEVWERNLGAPVARIPLGLALMEADQADRSLDELRIGLQRATDAGISNDVIYQRALSLVHMTRGEWDDAVAESAGSLERESEEHGLGRMLPSGALALVRLHRGELDAARATVAAGDASLMAPGDRVGADLFLWAKASLLRAEGNEAAALETLAAVWSATETMRYLFGTWRLIWPDIVRLATSAGQQSLARDVVEAANEGARLADGIASARAAALHIRGLADGDPELLVTASGIYETAPRPFEGAMAAEDAGIALVDRGETERAAPLLARALDLYDDPLGAIRDVDRVRSALRSIGVRLGRHGTRKRPASGWDALTPTERRVVSLVSDGLTNGRIGERLFISPRTVQTHLRSAFDKLGATSRAEVVAEAIRRSHATSA